MWPTIYIPRWRKKRGIPPARTYLTTPPYPYELEEALVGSASIESITPGQYTDDELTSSASFVSAELVTRLREYDNGLDEIASTASFVSAELVTRLVTYDNKNDQILSTASFVSGELKDPLVTYVNWPLAVDSEDLKSSASFVSGVLA